MKNKKQEILSEAYKCAYNADCSNGLTGYRTPALDSLQPDVDDKSISKKQFLGKVSNVLKQIL